MSNPWDTPDHPGTGDQDSGILFASIGEALTYWEFVEEALASFFALCIGSSSYPAYPHEPALRAYGSVISFNGRLTMVRVAAEAFFQRELRSEKLEGEFRSLLNTCGGWAGRRNDIAHGKVWGSPQGYVLYPGLYNTKKQPLSAMPAYCYNSTQIKQFQNAFQTLAGQLEAATRRLEMIVWQALPQRQAPPQADPNSENPDQ